MKMKASAAVTFTPGPTRAEIVLESSALCEGCGADPRNEDTGALADPRWSVGVIKKTLATHRYPDDYCWGAVIRCPGCAAKT